MNRPVSKPATFKFRLYIAGEAQNSALALGNLQDICTQHLLERHEIEVIDVFREPRRALVDAIFMTPTLVRVAPGPSLRIVGTLSEKSTVVRALGLPTVPP